MSLITSVGLKEVLHFLPSFFTLKSNMKSSDNAKRAAMPSFSFTSSGHSSARNCAIGSHHVLNTTGGRVLPWRGAKVWTCAACVAARGAKSV